MSEKQGVLILQHSLESPAGRVGDILAECGIPYHLVHPGRGRLPDPGRYQALVVLGGSPRFNGGQQPLYTFHEEAYLQQAIRHGLPYLGMCMGGQLLAHAFHARVMRLPKVHIGFLQSHCTEAGRSDPLYKNLPFRQQAFQRYEDCFLLPKGAVALAHLADGFNQAFRYTRRAYGMQYSVELSEEMLDGWLHDTFLKREFIDAFGSAAYRKIEQEALELFPAYAQHSSLLLRNFFSLSELI